MTETKNAIKGVMDFARKQAQEEIAIKLRVSSTVNALAKSDAEKRKSIANEESASKRRITSEEERHRQNVAKANLMMARRMARDSVKEHERAEREKTRATEREARQRAQAERRYTREMEREQRDKMFDRKRLYRSVGTGWVEGGANALNLVGNVVRTGVRGVSQGLGLGDATNVGDIVAENMAVRKAMRATAIEARNAGEGFSFDERGGAKRVADVARRTGTSQRDLLKAIDIYSEKGSGATAIRDLDKIVRQSSAMGADVGDIAKLRSQLEQQSKLAGKTLSSDEIDETMAQLHFIGKTGVFRSKDIAKESESMFAAFTAGGIDYRSGMYRYAQFANLARSQKGSGAEARTSINAALQTVQKKRDKIKHLGVSTENKDGSTRDAIEVIMDTISATGGDRSRLSKIFDPSRSGYAINPLVGAFNQAYQGTKGSEAVRRAAGKKAMDSLLQRGMADQGVSMSGKELVAEMDKDSAAAMGGAGQDIKKSIETVRQSILGALLPALEKLSSAMPGIVEKFTRAVDFVQKHPVAATMALGMGMATFGAAKGAAGHVLGGLARYAGDRLAQRQFGGAAGFLAKGAGSMLGAAAQAGSQNVFVTGAAPGVMGGGPGGLDPLGGGAMRGGLLSTILPYLAIAAAAVGAGYVIANAASKILPVAEPVKATADEMKLATNAKTIERGQHAGMMNVLHRATFGRRKTAAEQFFDFGGILMGRGGATSDEVDEDTQAEKSQSAFEAERKRRLDEVIFTNKGSVGAAAAMQGVRASAMRMSDFFMGRGGAEELGLPGFRPSGPATVETDTNTLFEQMTGHKSVEQQKAEAGTVEEATARAKKYGLIADEDTPWIESQKDAERAMKSFTKTLDSASESLEEMARRNRLPGNGSAFKFDVMR